jgi:hypothetical protein
MATQTSCPAPPPQPAPSAASNAIAIGADSALLISAIGWLVWDRLLKQQLATKLEGVFAPIEEERKLNNLVAQVGIISNASRVILCAFHNGAINENGYHLVKISTINNYVAPGATPMADPIRDLPIGRVMNEIERMLRKQAKAESPWDLIAYSPNLPQPCRDHLRRNSIHRMYNRLVQVGNLPIGILSLQFQESEDREPPLGRDAHGAILDGLYDEIAIIMRRRIVSPGILKRLLLFFRGGLGKRSSR